jgi:hypothetical protein
MRNSVSPPLYESMCVHAAVTMLRERYTSLNRVYCENAVRTFHKSTDPEAFEAAIETLKTNHWGLLRNKQTEGDFHMIEVDCLLHLYDDTNLSLDPLEYGNSFYLIPAPRPKDGEAQVVTALFRRKISELALPLLNGEELADEMVANCYAIFEITLDPKMLQEKVAQLERDLTVLLQRHQHLQNDTNITIGNLVRFAGIITKNSCTKLFIDILSKHASKLPLLTELWHQNRLVCGSVVPDDGYVADRMSLLDAHSDSLVALSPLSTEILKEQLLKSQVERKSAEDKADIEKEKAAIEKEQAAIEKEKAAIEKEQAAIEKEQAAIEKEQAAIEKEKMVIEKEQAAIEKEKTVIEKKKVEFDLLASKYAFFKLSNNEPKMKEIERMIDGMGI